MNFIDRVNELLSTKNISQSAFADSLNIRKANFSDWKKSGNCPSADIAYKIAVALNTTVDYLVSGETPDTGLSSDESELLMNYRKLKAATKKIVSVEVSALASSQS